MTRVLLWKEIRDQGTVLAALLVLGSAILVAASIVFDSAETRGSVELRSFSAGGLAGLVMLLMTAGVVVGAALFAGEREAGTFGFLDRLPGSRWRIWWRKVLVGAGFVGIAASVLLGVALAAGLLEGKFLTAWVVIGYLIAFIAYGWGVLGSALMKSSLAASGFGLGLATVCAIVAFAFTAIALTVARDHSDYVQDSAHTGQSYEYAILATLWCLATVPLPLSAWLFTGPDRSRGTMFAAIPVPGIRGIVGSRVVRFAPHLWGRATRRLVWLMLRQNGTSALVLTGIALAIGCTMLIPEAQPIVLWPILTFAAGTFAAIVGVVDEQQSNSVQFWGERRMPIGRLWFAKIASGLGLTLLLTVATALPLTIGHVLGEDTRGPFVPALFRTGLMVERGFPWVSYLFLWPVYGFAFTHLAALLFRKTVIAAVVGAMIAGTFAAFWIPSLSGGGLHAWQVFAPPVAALILARLLVRAWSTNRLGNRGPLGRLALGSAAVLGIAAVALGYRVAEVPLVPEANEHVEFAKTLPSFDEKQSGRDLRRAVGLYSDLAPAVRFEKIDGPPTRRTAARLRSGNAVLPSYMDETESVLLAGYPADRPDFDDWLLRMYAPDWDEQFAIAAKKPLGVLEDVNEFNFDSQFKMLDPVRQMIVLLLVRGLQRQALGRPDEFLDALDGVYPALRITGNQSMILPTVSSRRWEYSVADAVDRWLERLAGRPDLLDRAIRIVLDHEANDPYKLADVRLAEQTFLGNAFVASSQWLPKYLEEIRPGRRRARDLDFENSEAQVESNLVSFAWTVPWEKERHRRIVGLGNRPGRSREQAEYLRGAPAVGSAIGTDDRMLDRLDEIQIATLTSRRATLLKLAIRRFEAIEGRVPTTLEALVPKYLKSLPEDPYAKKPFGYRISQGETIELPGVDDAAAAGAPPGLIPAELSAGEFTAVAGAFGGGVCWPLVPEWFQQEATEPEFSPNFPGNGLGDWARLRTPKGLAIEVGQPILWSVGPDRSDSGGTIPASGSGARSFGDLLFPVPRGPKP